MQEEVYAAVRRYIDKFGYFPVEFCCGTDEDLIRTIDKCIASGIPPITDDVAIAIEQGRISELSFASSLSLEEIEENFKDTDVFSGVMDGLNEALSHSRKDLEEPENIPL